MKEKAVAVWAALGLLLMASLLQAQTRLDDPISDPISKGALSVGLEEVVAGFTFPTDLEDPGDQSGRLFVAELGSVDVPGGKIKIIKNDTVLATPFLDLSVLSGSISSASLGLGLTGFAFHPEFADESSLNWGKLYTVSTEVAGSGMAHFGSGGHHQSVIYEWRVSGSMPDLVDVTTPPREILRINQPRQEHNVNEIAFGPEDGLLYIALGDGGNNNSLSANGQNPETIFGSILRIDVNDTAGNGRYSIPTDNPFAQTNGDEVKEIFAYGLRNPYRISFDRETHVLYTGDVGQESIEEINRIEWGQNYGWNQMEGTFKYLGFGNGVTDDLSSLPDEFLAQDPIAQYDHDEGRSVIGGFVYRGSLMPQLVGRYVFGDFTSGRLFHLDFDTGVIQEFSILSSGTSLPGQILGFGQDAAGELYVFGTDGRVVRLIPEPETLVMLAVGAVMLTHRRRRVAV